MTDLFTSNVQRGISERKEELVLAVQEMESRGLRTAELAETIENLALCYQISGQAKAALPYYDKALNLYAELANTEFLALCHEKVAWAHYGEDNIQAAHEHFNLAERARGESVSSSLRKHKILASMYLANNKLEKAESHMRAMLDIISRDQNAANYYEAFALVCLTLVSLLQGQADEAKEFTDRAAAVVKDKCAIGYTIDFLSLAEIVNLYIGQGRLAEARQAAVDSLIEQEDAVWSLNPVASQALFQLADLFRAQRKFKLAESCFKRTLDSRLSLYGPNSQDYANAAMGLSTMYLATKKYSDAEPLLKAAMKARVRQFGAEHPSVAACVETYAALLKKTKRAALATKLESRAREIRSRFVGEWERKSAQV